MDPLPHQRTPEEWQLLVESFLNAHPHCTNCISINCPGPVNSCPMQLCELKCGLRFHSCKADEHELLCPNKTVKCINLEFGCSQKVQRRLQASHLPTCPASVVICSSEWGRVPKVKSEVVPVLAKHLDEVLAFRDQNHLNNASFPSHQLRMAPVHFDGDFSHQPLRAKAHRSLEAHKERMKMVRLGLTKNNDMSKPWPLLLNTVIEFGTKYHISRPDKYFYTCGTELRRDMFPWHFKNVHNEILSCVNGWLEHRCPLEAQGCTFSERRLYPDTPCARVVFHSEMDCFAVMYQNEENTVEKSNMGQRSLCSLPQEVLEEVCCYLDPLSLANLSLTCHFLRDMCAAVFLPRQGIVSLEWKKTDLPGPNWQVSAKKWRFPKFFTPVKKWGFHNYEPIVKHMAECPMYERFDSQVPYDMKTGLSREEEGATSTFMQVEENSPAE